MDPASRCTDCAAWAGGEPAVIVTPAVTPAPTSPARIAAAVSGRQPLRHGCRPARRPRPAGPRRRGERRRRWRRRWRQPGRGGRQRSAHLSHVQAERAGHRLRQPARRRVGRLRPAIARRWAAGPGSLARQRSTSGRTSAGTASEVRLAVHHAVDQRRGGPGAERSLAGGGEGQHRAQAEDVAGRSDLRPSACSGDMNPGEPTTSPVCVSAVASTAREIPKSITRGPSSASSTFAGLRSRCTTPAAWIALSPSASPAASARTERGRQRPVLAHSVRQRRPGHVSRRQPRHRPVHVRVHHRSREQAAHLPRGRDLPRGTAPGIQGLGQIGADHLHRHQAGRPATGRDTPGPCRPRPVARAAGTARSAADLQAVARAS